jgi:hypothetical protein
MTARALSATRTRGRPPLGAVLVHPAVVAALAILVVNDHFLKWHYPGIVTGKLSDFAGALLAPLVLVAICDALAPHRWLRHPTYRPARAWGSAAVVALVFAAVKTWPAATQAYEAAFRSLWGGHVVLVRDPTDLFALPMALVAATVGARRRTE